MTVAPALRTFTDVDVIEALARFVATGEQQWLGGAPDLDNMRAHGHSYGYPECCIEAFVADVAADRYPAQLRGVGPDGCVPCPLCRPTALRPNR